MFLQAYITVAWFLDNRVPIAVRGILACFFAMYITICRASEISRLRDFVKIASGSML